MLQSIESSGGAQDEEAAPLLPRKNLKARRSEGSAGGINGLDGIPGLSFIAGDHADIWMLSTNGLGDSETIAHIAQVGSSFHLHDDDDVRLIAVSLFTPPSI